MLTERPVGVRGGSDVKQITWGVCRAIILLLNFMSHVYDLSPQQLFFFCYVSRESKSAILFPR